MNSCAWCGVPLKDEDEVFIGDDGEGVYCNSDCYRDWFMEHFYPGYYTVLSIYKSYLSELEKKRDANRPVKVKTYGRKGRRLA